MAITPVQPVARPQQRVERSGGKLGKPLGTALGLAGGIAGGIVGAAGGPASAAQGALGGFAAGQATGQGLGGLIDPAKSKVVSNQPMASAPMPTQSVSQKYKMSDNGRIALEGLRVAQADPDFAEYQEPLALAIMNDIAQNNPRTGRA